MAVATVVVVNWNGRHLLPACLDAVRAQDLPAGDFETWVVDNASSDGSVELLRRDYPWVRVVETGANLGFAGGNNAALRLVTTPFAVLLNNDATPEPDWLRRTLDTFAEPGAEKVGCVTPKIVFMPRFVRLALDTAGFVPGPHDTRDLGVRVHGVRVGGADVFGDVLWERLTYGREGDYTWTRPGGELLLPVPGETGPKTEAAHRVSFAWAGERPKPVTLTWDGGSVTLDAAAEPAWAEFELPAGTPVTDVVNNAGGIVLREGYGADRGFQQVDDGRYDTAEEVFTFCGNGVAFRREVLEQVGVFDDDFFLYYEDTDLSWRVRAAGWSIRYQPAAVLRHHHASSSGEWSPLFTFHVDRNRLLMLTKNASAGLALRQVLRYPLTTASMALRAARIGLAEKRRPAVRPTLLRLKVIGSYLRLLPRMLARRRAIAAGAVVPRGELEKWLVSR